MTRSRGKSRHTHRERGRVCALPPAPSRIVCPVGFFLGRSFFPGQSLTLMQSGPSSLAAGRWGNHITLVYSTPLLCKTPCKPPALPHIPYAVRYASGLQLQRASTTAAALRKRVRRGDKQPRARPLSSQRGGGGGGAQVQQRCVHHRAGRITWRAGAARCRRSHPRTSGSSRRQRRGSQSQTHPQTP